MRQHHCERALCHNIDNANQFSKLFYRQNGISPPDASNRSNVRWAIQGQTRYNFVPGAAIWRTRSNIGRQHCLTSIWYRHLSNSTKQRRAWFWPIGPMMRERTRLNRRQAIGALLQKIWKSHSIQISTKIRLMKALVWHVAKYGCES